MRAYSVAGKLSDNQFGLLIDSSPGGLGSQYAEKLQVGDEIKFIGPVGNLKFNPDCDCEQIVFLAIGCGIAPVKAMIEAALKQHNLQKPMTLYLGTISG